MFSVCRNIMALVVRSDKKNTFVTPYLIIGSLVLLREHISSLSKSKIDSPPRCSASPPPSPPCLRVLGSRGWTSGLSLDSSSRGRGRGRGSDRFEKAIAQYKVRERRHGGGGGRRWREGRGLRGGGGRGSYLSSLCCAFFP
jgi:hypothetical protein